MVDVPEGWRPLILGAIAAALWPLAGPVAMAMADETMQGVSPSLGLLALLLPVGAVLFWAWASARAMLARPVRQQTTEDRTRPDRRDRLEAAVSVALFGIWTFGVVRGADAGPGAIGAVWFGLLVYAGAAAQRYLAVTLARRLS